MIYTNKGQGLTMNTIILAALALIALVVIAYIFLGKATLFGKGAVDCENKGGDCIPENSCDGEVVDFRCEDNLVCCLTLCGALGGECRSSCDDDKTIAFTNCPGNDVCCKN